MPSAADGATRRPSSSGPRCQSASIIRRVIASPSSDRSIPITPQIPHIRALLYREPVRSSTVTCKMLRILLQQSPISSVQGGFLKHRALRSVGIGRYELLPAQKRAATTKPGGLLLDRFCSGRSVLRSSGRNGHCSVERRRWSQGRDSRIRIENQYWNAWPSRSKGCSKNFQDNFAIA